MGCRRFSIVMAPFEQDDQARKSVLCVLRVYRLALNLPDCKLDASSSSDVCWLTLSLARLPTTHRPTSLPPQTT